jgi:hypothetical protein
MATIARVMGKSGSFYVSYHDGASAGYQMHVKIILRGDALSSDGRYGADAQAGAGLRAPAQLVELT